MVNPIAKSDILCCLARDDAPLIIQSAPFIRRKKPMIIKLQEINTDIFYSF
jgi:hypothetical protein